MLDVFNTLLRHLRASVNTQCMARLPVIKSSDTASYLDVTDSVAAEQRFQNAVVAAIGMMHEGVLV